MKDTSVSVCPVPAEQQPLNEYQELKESWFFRWGISDLRGYLTGIAWVWGISWAISGPVAASSFVPKKYLGQFLLSGAAGASFILALVLLRLYLGWWYVRNRLLNSTVVYEESGWYDGQCWEKNPEMLLRDRLVVTHQIQPILGRLHRTFGVLALAIVAGSLTWQFLSFKF
ncbi:CGLD27 family protein [Microcoleus sp. FACHB-68]|uniref:CGLD27 family protein n=1 Tax=Microcoleus sp. FACHB-68 TaxID=2692826 RepID=UPI001686DD34|nr:CGLD27 family protein [Microcoleus sp. FACHB-68]MBD1937134.1 CGLD27 family protein [Microcoleus sp. FACHB-68]